MHQANIALSLLSSPCPVAPFGSVIVNHSDTSSSPHGELICIGINQAHETGNQGLHGEISAINNCSRILTDPEGKYRYSPGEAAETWKELSLYTNAEPCPMCASAIRWSSFAELIYGTSISTLIKQGWRQITIPSNIVFENADSLGPETRLIGDVLRGETDVLFSWQYERGGWGECPTGCKRDRMGEGIEDEKGWCVPAESEERYEL